MNARFFSAAYLICCSTWFRQNEEQHEIAGAVGPSWYLARVVSKCWAGIGQEQGAEWAVQGHFLGQFSRAKSPLFRFRKL